MEIHDPTVLSAWLADGRSLSGVRLQDLDLSPCAAQLLAVTDARGLVLLGGVVPTAVADHLRLAGAMVFPAAPDAPVNIFRAHLYTGPELYDGLAQGYSATPDARAYAWAMDARAAHDAYATLLRAIHDDSISDALDEWVDGRSVVGIMGGHDAHRGTSDYADAARLGFRLADQGLLVATGGGPGAMEAANLGAVAPSTAALDAALARLARAPSFEPDSGAWVGAAFEVLEDFAGLGRGSVEPQIGLRHPVARPGRLDPAPAARSLGIPTWFYGHEPPNVFAEGIAKYFSNAIREDGLLARSNAGVVVMPGAAGTVQEIFQLANRLYYALPGDAPTAVSDPTSLAPLVLVGAEHWSSNLPAVPLLRALARDRPMAGAIHAVDTVDEAVAVITGRS